MSSTTGLAPLVDVVLLLLIFLLISARFDSSQVIEIDLPRAPESGTRVPASESPRVLTLARDGTLAWNQTPVERAELRDILLAESPETRLLPIVIRGDAGATWGDGLQLVIFLRGLGYAECVFEYRELSEGSEVPGG